MKIQQIEEKLSAMSHSKGFLPYTMKDQAWLYDQLKEMIATVKFLQDRCFEQTRAMEMLRYEVQIRGGEQHESQN